MAPWIVLSAALVATLLLAVFADRLGTAPGPKRVHLFEDDKGNRQNPLQGVSAGASSSGARCRDCGDRLRSASYRYCTGCLGSGAADD